MISGWHRSHCLKKGVVQSLACQQKYGNAQRSYCQACLLLCHLTFFLTPGASTSIVPAEITKVMHNRSLHSVDMHGECAVVTKREEWGSPGDEQWDLHVKVAPWTVFGHVEMRFAPATVAIDAVWAGTKLSEVVDGNHVVVVIELGSAYQEDYTFDISGSTKFTSLTMSCSRLVQPQSDCEMKPSFAVLNSFQDVMASQINIDGWQVGAIFDVHFYSAVTVTKIWNAEQVLDDDNPGGEFKPGKKPLRVRLLALPVNTPKERLSSFGFDVSPALHRFPEISCQLAGLLSPPPPPSMPPPTPPPPHVTEIDEHDCFLGGSLFFSREPDPDAVGLIWEMDFTTAQWLPGVSVTFDFSGESWKLNTHPVEIDSVQPPDAMTQEALTHHSVTFKLNDAFSGGTVKLSALGLIDGVSRVTCCCAPPPPPPPWSPPLPKPMPPPSPRPRPPPRSQFQHTEDGIIQGVTSSAMDQQEEDALLSDSSVVSVKYATLWSVAAIGSLGLILLLCRSVFSKVRSWQAKKRIAKTAQELAARASLARSSSKGSRNSCTPRPSRASSVEKRELVSTDEPAIDDCEAGDDGDTTADETASDISDHISAHGDGRTPMNIQVSDSTVVTARVNLRASRSMLELQKVVVREWVHAGGSQQDSLMLQYEDDTGKMRNVSRSTHFELVQRAASLSLRRKGAAKENDERADLHLNTGPTRKYGRICQLSDLP